MIHKIVSNKINNIITLLKMNESELFLKYKSSYKSAFLDLYIHTFYLFCAFYLIYFFRNSWLSIFTIPLMGLLNIKTYLIFHDCGHHSYTPNKILNYIIGIITGIIINTPFNQSFSHDIHHMTNGNMNNNYNYRHNATILHSLKQYKNFSFPIQQLYKLLRHPYIFFSVVPIIYFNILLRFNGFIKKKLIIQNINTFIIIEQIINNLGIFILYWLTYKNYILYHYILSSIITSIIGIIIFHNQHTFNPPYVVNNETWNKKDSGLKGSSFIQMPYLLKYFTEYHHVHHMNAKIPNYNLQKYHEEVISKSNMFDNIVKLSLIDCYNNLWLVLYDEDNNKYITFEEADKKIL